MTSKLLESLVSIFKELPGVGHKSAERMVYALLDFDKDKLIELSKKLEELTFKIVKCDKCNCLIDNNDGCPFCNSKNRNNEKLIVLEKSKDILNFEKNNIYNGMYFVLEKLISPMDGYGPEVIHIQQIINRIENDKVKEVILAIKPTIEGETTMNYIINSLKKLDVRISKIPIGIPVGLEIEYLDAVTLELAFNDRKNII